LVGALLNGVYDRFSAASSEIYRVTVVPPRIGHALLLFSTISDNAFRLMKVGVAISVRMVVPMMGERQMNVRSLVVRWLRLHAVRMRTHCPLGSEKTRQNAHCD
jgi:hypothetical protein